MKQHENGFISLTRQVPSETEEQIIVHTIV